MASHNYTITVSTAIVCACSNTAATTDMRHSLANFTLMGDTEESSLFDFEGRDYKKKGGSNGMLINLPA
eukprot:1240-Heterococcus_DN1.PRE.1